MQQFEHRTSNVECCIQICVGSRALELFNIRPYDCYGLPGFPLSPDTWNL